MRVRIPPALFDTRYRGIALRKAYMLWSRFFMPRRAVLFFSEDC